MSSLFVSWISERSSVKNAALVGRDHILDVDESVFSSVDFEHFKSWLYEIAKISWLSLTVVDLVAEVLVLDLEKVKNGKDLSVVGYEGLSDGVRAGDQSLQNLECDWNNLGVTRVQGDYEWS